MKKLLSSSFCLIFLYLCSTKFVFSQESPKKDNFINIGFGYGINDLVNKFGAGPTYKIGWQKTIGKKDRLRINPSFTFGQYSNKGVKDAGDNYYTANSLGLDLNYDLVRYKTVSVVTIGGFSFIRASGLKNPGLEWPISSSNNYPSFFTKYYMGAQGALSLRINPKNSKITFEILPLYLQLSKNEFVTAYSMLNIGFKLR